MEEIFPQTLFVSSCGSGDDRYLNASETEESAIKATDDGDKAFVAEYRLVTVRRRAIVITVADA